MARSALAGLAFALTIALAGAALLLWASEDVEASHFRGGTLSWAPAERYCDSLPITSIAGVGCPGPVNGTGNDVYFYGRSAWQIGSIVSPPQPGDLMTLGTLVFGDGTSEQAYVLVLTVDPAQGIVEGAFADADGNPWIMHRYSSTTTNYIAYFSEFCWLTTDPFSLISYTLHNNGCETVRLETEVGFVQSNLPEAPSITLGANSAPVVESPLMHVCVRGEPCVIPLLASDRQNALLSWRFATAAEATGGTWSQPSGSTISPLGVFTWPNTATAPHDPMVDQNLFSAAVMVEDGHTKTPYQFLIWLVDNPL